MKIVYRSLRREVDNARVRARREELIIDRVELTRAEAWVFLTELSEDIGGVHENARASISVGAYTYDGVEISWPT
jgi:hypothetical protein